MKQQHTTWPRDTVPSVLAELEEARPLTVPLIIQHVEDESARGSRYDGDAVTVSFSYARSWGIVQLQVLNGYALALAFEDGLPTDSEGRAKFHDVFMSVFFRLSKIDENLASAFKEYCIPKSMSYLSEQMERVATAGSMN